MVAEVMLALFSGRLPETQRGAGGGGSTVLMILIGQRQQPPGFVFGGVGCRFYPVCACGQN